MKNLQTELKEKYYYYNGSLFYKKATNKSYMCQPAGSMHHSGRLVLGFNDKQWQLHRLIYLFHYGEVPKYLDHIDCNPLNNSIENLRPATMQQNAFNIGKRPMKNAEQYSKYKGVVKSADKFRVGIKVNSKTHYIGIFNTEIEAAEAYNKKALELHGEYARLNVIN